MEPIKEINSENTTNIFSQIQLNNNDTIHENSDFDFDYIPNIDDIVKKMNSNTTEELSSSEESISKKSNQSYIRKTETINEWWIGKVSAINYDQRYFTASLKNIKGQEFIAEFDFSSTFDDEYEINEFLHLGMEFAFYVLTEHGDGRPRTISKIEFSTPYIWSESDDVNVDAIYNDLFPNG